MLGVEEALDKILQGFSVLEAEDKPILEAAGQVLAEDINGRFDIPPWQNSAMDGFAVRSNDLINASKNSPVFLDVVGSVAAGQAPTQDVKMGTAVRIMTGAPIPRGADTVVPFEDTDEERRTATGQSLSQIGVRVRTTRCENVRPAGQDIRKGDMVLAKGTILGASHVGVLASLGSSKVRVVRRPTVAIISTGDELLEPGNRRASHKIYDTNGYSLYVAIAQAGGIPKRLGIAGDNLDALGTKLDDGLDSNLLVTSAGVSKGDYDVVKNVLVERGEIGFWSVKMRPAKPLAFGVLEGPEGRLVPHLGLPGNPVSALVAFEQFGRPAVHKMMGKPATARPTLEAILEDPIYNDDERRVYARVLVTLRDGVYYAKLTGHQSSNLLTSMVRANGLAICPEDVQKKDAGEMVTVQMIDWPEDVF